MRTFFPIAFVAGFSRSHIIYKIAFQKEGARQRFKNMKEIVTVKNLGVSYQSENGEIEALRNVNLSVYEGEFAAIVGPSGCGKSTLLSAIAGLHKPTYGEVSISGGGRYGYMLQRDGLFEWRTIMQNVTLGLEISKTKTPENIAYVQELLRMYGLYEFRDKFPSQLSGGMRQRCALIRTLALRPPLLLLDEPFSALDYQTRLAVSDDIYSIIKGEKKTALMVTHDISEAVSMADRVIILSARPGTIKGVIDIDFPTPRLPMKCRESDKFRDYFNTIWKELDIHV